MCLSVSQLPDDAKVIGLGHLAAKEKESKHLKELMEKQLKVQVYKESMKRLMLNKKNLTGAANAAAQSAMSNKQELPLNRINELRTWIATETDVQSNRYLLQEEILKQVS